MKTNVSSRELLRHDLSRDKVRVEVVIQELGPKRRMFTPEDLGLSQPKLVGPLIDMVSAAAAAAHNGDGNGAAAAAAAAAVAGPSLATHASIASIERLQANKFLALLGYMGPELRDRMLAGGGLEELQQQQQGMRSSAAATAPAAPSASTDLHPAEGDAAAMMRRLQEQLGLQNPTGNLDEDTLEVLANKHRYNTHPEKVDDDHPEADLKVVFIPFKDYNIDRSLDILKVGPDFCVFPHYLSVVAPYPVAGLLTASSGGKTSAGKSLPATSSGGKTSSDKGLPASSSGGTPLTAPVTPPDSGPKKPLPLPGRQGSAKIIIDTTWAFWMLPTTSQKVHDFYGAFYLEPLLLHNIGSALGLRSSGKPDDVMCPFYSENHKCLTENDKQRARNLYP
ncbi:hypothetical protein PLESTM_000716400 [Pleodorina starrii]|nr:hypothetical protein PLESTM_000716400 [Pleodorina starrii]